MLAFFTPTSLLVSIGTSADIPFSSCRQCCSCRPTRPTRPFSVSTPVDTTRVDWEIILLFCLSTRGGCRPTVDRATSVRAAATKILAARSRRFGGTTVNAGVQGWALCSVTFFHRPRATTSLYSVCTSSRIDTNPLTRTTRESRRTSSTVMLQKTPRAGDGDMHEHSHIVTDAGELSAVAHTDDCRGPHGSHTTPLSACDAQCAAQSSPVHPSPLRSTHRRWLHSLMPFRGRGNRERGLLAKKISS